MLEHYTFQKLLEYEQAERNNPITIRREQEKQMICEAAQTRKAHDKWYVMPLRLFRKSHRRQKYRT
ncbi:hypothetical protein [Paenibacillus sp. FSL W8-0194]|uniref:hypothetical protein n=1 Tax=Paenibacillus sp. FSL W8-0194 TaxID=2921711 RepID=UPI0030D725E9